MNGPVVLDRRRVLAGSGALIVSFSLSNAFRTRLLPPRRPNPQAVLQRHRFLIPGYV